MTCPPTADKTTSPGWRLLGLTLGLSLFCHLAFGVWATYRHETVQIAGGAESPATTIGQAFTDMVIAGSNTPAAEAETVETDDTVEPEEVERIEPVAHTAEKPVPVAEPVDVPEIQQALTSSVVYTASDGNFVKSETTIEKPLEAEPTVQNAIRPATEADQIAREEIAPETVAAPEVQPAQVSEALKAEPPVTSAITETTNPEEAEPAEQVATAVPVPQVRPKPLVREPTRQAQQKKSPSKQQVRKKKSSPSQGANGGASQTAQRGGAQRSGRGTEAGNAAVSNYPGKVARKLRRALRYPSAAKRERLNGQVVVRFTVNANGSATGIRIARSSGSSILDHAALETVRRASPFPKIPQGASRNTWGFTVPLAFRR